MKNWIQTTPVCDSLEAVIERNTGMSASDFVQPYPETHIENLSQAADFIKGALASGKSVSIYGDYDADGVTSSAILTLVLRHMGCDPQVLLPRRFTDGYGFKKERLDDVTGDVLITVDNGIAAADAIAAAKDKGLAVLILDHHLPPEDGILPAADVIVNPHVFKRNENDFDAWCGAGISYRLAKLLIDDSQLLAICLSLAAIGTVADVVELRSRMAGTK